MFSTPIAINWEHLISSEFSQQAAREEELGLEVAPFMQGLDDPQHRAKLQAGFITFVALPLWKQVARIWPTMHDCLSRLNANLEHFQELQKHEPSA